MILNVERKKKNFIVQCPVSRRDDVFQWFALSGMVDFRAVTFLAALAISGEQLITFLFPQRSEKRTIVPCRTVFDSVHMEKWKYNTMQLVLYYYDKSFQFDSWYWKI